MRWRAGTGPGRARYLVQLGAVAVLDAGLARPDGGSGLFLSYRCAGDGLRDHLPVGSADDYDGDRVHGRAALPSRVSARHHPPPGRIEDQQVEPAAGRRSARRDRGIWRRRPALLDCDRQHAGAGRAPFAAEDRQRAELRQQAVERRPLCRTGP